jgi:hypothetical protein
MCVRMCVIVCTCVLCVPAACPRRPVPPANPPAQPQNRRAPPGRARRPQSPPPPATSTYISRARKAARLLDRQLRRLLGLVVHEPIALGRPRHVGRDLARQDRAELAERVVQRLVVDRLVEVLDEDVAHARLFGGFGGLGGFEGRLGVVARCVKRGGFACVVWAAECVWVAECVCARACARVLGERGRAAAQGSASRCTGKGARRPPTFRRRPFLCSPSIHKRPRGLALRNAGSRWDHMMRMGRPLTGW